MIGPNGAQGPSGVRGPLGDLNSSDDRDRTGAPYDRTGALGPLKEPDGGPGSLRRPGPLG